MDKKLAMIPEIKVHGDKISPIKHIRLVSNNTLENLRSIVSKVCVETYADLYKFTLTLFRIEFYLYKLIIIIYYYVSLYS